MLDARTPVRVARPVRNLERVAAFWRDGVGLEQLYRSEASGPGGHTVVMLGWPGAGWHLELVDDGGDTQPSPSEEDLLVFYLGEEIGDELIDRLLAAGGRRVPAKNPYWDRFGVTVEDPDGYRLVLSHRSWP